MIKRILDLIAKKGITREQFATDIGVAKNAISEWKSGRIRPNIDVVVKIARYFGVSTDYLLTGEEAHKKCWSCGVELR